MPKDLVGCTASFLHSLNWNENPNKNSALQNFVAMGCSEAFSYVIQLPVITNMHEEFKTGCVAHIYV